MVIRSVRVSLLAFTLLALALGSCKRGEETQAGAAATPPVSAPQPFRVTSVDVGKEIDASKRIASPGAEFEANDTIYASIASEGAAPEVKLVARWTFEDGQLVSESSQVIAPTGPAVTEFHIAKPGGLPEGRYKLEVSANGRPAGVREFEVR